MTLELACRAIVVRASSVRMLMAAGEARISWKEDGKERLAHAKGRSRSRSVGWTYGGSPHESSSVNLSPGGDDLSLSDSLGCERREEGSKSAQRNCYKPRTDGQKHRDKRLTLSGRGERLLEVLGEEKILDEDTEKIKAKKEVRRVRQKKAKKEDRPWTHDSTLTPQ